MAVLLSGAAAGHARAEDEAVASLRLRGGYDSNPTLVYSPRGSAFAGVDAAVALGRTADDFSAALVAEASQTYFADSSADPVERYKLRAQFDSAGHGQASFRSATTLLRFSNYETRLSEAEQELRLRRAEGTVRPFVNARVRYTSLNEINAVLGEFLPEPQRFLRGTIIPGVLLKRGGLEIGASVNLSAARYADRLDLFGYRRDNERIEPFLFASYEGENFSAFASLSRLHGNWHDVDFSDVRRTMFEFAVSYSGGLWNAELGAARYATDTTFPVSPISIDTEISGRLTGRFGEAARATAFGRILEREFLDSPFRSRQTAFGIEFERDLGDDMTLAAEISRVRMRPIVGEPLHATTASLSLTRRYGSGAGEKLRAGTSLPPARPSR